MEARSVPDLEKLAAVIVNDTALLLKLVTELRKTGADAYHLGSAPTASCWTKIHTITDYCDEADTGRTIDWELYVCDTSDATRVRFKLVSVGLAKRKANHAGVYDWLLQEEVGKAGSINRLYEDRPQLADRLVEILNKEY